MSRIDFNSENYGHRLLLAQAMRDYARAPGRTLTGTKGGGESSLLSSLAEAGIAMSKSNLDRIAAAGHPDDREKPYGNNARRVAQFLADKGYFPPGQKPDDVFKLLPVFFGGYSEGCASVLRELEGTYRSYQYSEFSPHLATYGELTIRPLTPWNYAPFDEAIGNGHTPAAIAAVETKPRWCSGDHPRNSELLRPSSAMPACVHTMVHRLAIASDFLLNINDPFCRGAYSASASAPDWRVSAGLQVVSAHSRAGFPPPAITIDFDEVTS